MTHNKNKNNYFILTGAPGAGKTTLLEYLRSLGLSVVGEPARQILAEQRSIGGVGVSEGDTRLFVDLMLSRMVGEYNRLATATTPVFFDRGIPDAEAYASVFGFKCPHAEMAGLVYRYNRVVFFAPPWEEIYTQDEERTVSFGIASEFDPTLRAIYRRLGYELIDLPRASVKERAQFILSHV